MASSKHEGSQRAHDLEQKSREADEALDRAVTDSLQEGNDPSQGSSAARSPSVDERVAEAERQVLQARAELENFRKRMQRDSELQLKYAHMPLVRDLLEVVDNLHRAAEAAQGEAANADGLRKGVEMVLQQLAGVLDKYGCKRIRAVGTEFDPNHHEAIAQMPSEEHPSGHVAQEVAVGYRLHDRVVRPSSVIVSTGPAQPQH